MFKRRSTNETAAVKKPEIHNIDNQSISDYARGFDDGWYLDVSSLVPGIWKLNLINSFVTVVGTNPNIALIVRHTNAFFSELQVHQLEIDFCPKIELANVFVDKFRATYTRFRVSESNLGKGEIAFCSINVGHNVNFEGKVRVCQITEEIAEKEFS